MRDLLPRLKKYSEEIFPTQRPLFQTLARGQKPHTLMITCSDSRIDPNLVTQAQPGEIFIVRNAGNLVPAYGASASGEEAAIEFAVEGLGVSNIVLCGHSQCGAMSALLGQVRTDTMPSLQRWLSHAEATRRRLDDMDSMSDDSRLMRAVEENVLVQAANLKTHPSVSAALRAGRTRIFAWVYHLETGGVDVFDREQRRYIPASELRGPLPQETRFEL